MAKDGMKKIGDLNDFRRAMENRELGPLVSPDSIIEGDNFGTDDDIFSVEELPDIEDQNIYGNNIEEDDDIFKVEELPDIEALLQPDTYERSNASETKQTVETAEESKKEEHTSDSVSREPVPHETASKAEPTVNDNVEQKETERIQEKMKSEVLLGRSVESFNGSISYLERTLTKDNVALRKMRVSDNLKEYADSIFKNSEFDVSDDSLKKMNIEKKDDTKSNKDLLKEEIEKIIKRIKEIEDALKTETSPEKIAALKKELGDLQKELASISKELANFLKENVYKKNNVEKLVELEGLYNFKYDEEIPDEFERNDRLKDELKKDEPKTDKPKEGKPKEGKPKEDKPKKDKSKDESKKDKTDDEKPTDGKAKKDLPQSPIGGGSVIQPSAPVYSSPSPVPSAPIAPATNVPAVKEEKESFWARLKHKFERKEKKVEKEDKENAWKKAIEEVPEKEGEEGKSYVGLKDNKEFYFYDESGKYVKIALDSLPHKEKDVRKEIKRLTKEYCKTKKSDLENMLDTDKEKEKKASFIELLGEGPRAVEVYLFTRYGINCSDNKDRDLTQLRCLLLMSKDAKDFYRIYTREMKLETMPKLDRKGIFGSDTEKTESKRPKGFFGKREYKKDCKEETEK